MKSFILYIVFLFVGLGLIAQNISNEVKTEIQQITNLYEQSTSLSQKVKVRLFDNWQGGELVESEEGEITKSGYFLHLEFAHVEYRVTEDYLLTIDHQNKFVMVGKRPKQLPSSEFEVDLVASLASCSSGEINEEGDKKYLVLHYEEHEYSKVVVTINKATSLIEKVVLFFSQATQLKEDSEPVKPRMEIRYVDVQLNKPIPSSKFSLNKYVENLEAPTLSLKMPFKDYRLVSTL